MEDSNASLKGTKAVNGINGSIKPSPGGPTRVSGRRIAPQGPGFLARSFSLTARLLIWYAILTLFFRCPATREACDETSPRICKPYFQIKHAVSPHFEPYYDAYAAPYVDLVRPYYDTVDRAVISPGWGYATQYGAPRVAQAQAHGKALWDSSVQPQLLKYQSSARAQYDRSLAPHVSRFSTTVGPYYDLARTNALQTYYELVLPSYEFLQPYAQQSYHVTSAFVTDTALPSAAWLWTKTYVFLDGTVWPQLRVIYGENVEPQLVRIGQRLGRHNGKTLTQKPTVESTTSLASTAASSFTKPAPPASSMPTSSSVLEPPSTPSPETSGEQTAEQSHVATESARVRNSAEQVQAPELEKGEVENDVRRTARETVASDLKDWQERYAKAADEGAAEIEESVAEISKNLINQNARTTGKALVEQLQSTVVSELVTLRRDILNIVGAVAKGNASPEAGHEKTTAVVRRAGMAIKEKAQEVRTWRENYEGELQAAITTAAQDHFKILDEIRDLAIQKIGMKWAWMDGVTYKDWAKYHQLKNRFLEWQGDLENLIVTHPDVEAAQAEGADIEDAAMSTAQSAAKELARLKQVANWKIVANDGTNEFDSDLMKEAAEAAEAAKAAKAAEEAFAEDVIADKGAEKAEEQTEEKAQPASGATTEAVAEAASVSEPADGTETAVPAEELVRSAASIISESVESASSAGKVTFESAASAGQDATSSVSTHSSNPTKESSSPTLENLAASASEIIHDPSVEANGGTEPVPEPADSTTPGTESATPENTEAPEQDVPELASEASATIFAEPPVVVGNATELEEDGPAPVELPVEESDIEQPIILEPTDEVSDQDYPIDEEVPVSSTTAVKPALFGAAAQSVPSREPIFDDDAFDNAANVMDSFRKDLPSTFASLAQSAYSAAISRANNQYSQALSIVSAQIQGTPQPMHEQMLASVTEAYSNAMASASSNLDAALQAAQEQFGTAPATKNIVPTAIPTPSVPTVDWALIESIATEKLNQGRAWAEEQYENAKIAIGASAPTPSTPSEHAEQLLERARHNYYAGLGVAHARYAEFVEAASVALSSMTATPTPTDLAGSASSMASVAGKSASSAGEAIADSWDAALSKISEQVYGAPIPTPWHESLYSAAGDYATSAVSAAGDSAASATSAAGTYAAMASDEAARQYSSVRSIVSELVVGKEPTFSESVYSRLDAVYSGGVASATSMVSAAQATASSVVSEAAEAARGAGEQVASAVSEATEVVKETVGQEKDEL